MSYDSEVTQMTEDRRYEEDSIQEDCSRPGSGSNISISGRQKLRSQDRKEISTISSRGKMLSNSILRGGGPLRLNHPVQIGLRSAVSYIMVRDQIFGNISLTPKLYIIIRRVIAQQEGGYSWKIIRMGQSVSITQ